MTRRDARIILCGLIPDGFDAFKMTPQARQEVRNALDKILELTHEATVVLAVSPQSSATESLP
jgi:hypothetical protein